MRAPGGGHRRGVAAEHAVRGRVPVAGHHLQRAALEVGDREAVAGAPGRVVPTGRRPVSVHLTVPAASTATSRRPSAPTTCSPCGDQPASEERAEPARAAVRPDRIRAAARDREHRAARAEAPRRPARWRRVARVKRSPIHHAPAGDSAVARPAHEEREARVPPARRSARRPAAAGTRSRQRRLHHRPAAGGRLGLARERLRRAGGRGRVRRAHRSITSPSRSSARRRREFTVPRGMSRARAISPGV